jgi:hypothetical protein
MRRPVLIAVLVCASAVGTAATAMAAAPISAKVPSGYRLVALSPSGTATAAKAVRGRVVLTPKAARVTLHLIGPDGAYAGPVVVGSAAKGRVVVGVRAGAKIGRIRIVRGVAVATPAASAIDRTRTAVARRGAPIGARSFGLVRSRTKGPSGPGRDRDLDGVPSAFDIDDDGDMILDNLDSAAAVARVTDIPMGPPPLGTPPLGTPPGPPTTPGPASGTAGAPRIFSNLKLPIDGSLNVNAGVTQGAIDAALAATATLAIAVPAGDAVELDCGTLTYCTTGGTGRAPAGGAFPDAFDGDGDGLGTIAAGTTGDFQLAPGAPSSRIGSGDAFLWRVTAGGRESLIPGVLNYQFVTTPAVTSYRVGAGAATTITYPVPASATGTLANPIEVPATGTVSVDLTIWRPQRAAIAAAGEAGDWVDIGGLTYSIDLPNGPSAAGAPGGQGPGLCDAGFLSSGDGSLAAGTEGLTDAAADRAPSPANTVNLAVDLTGCVASASGQSWDPGETLKVDIQARTNDGDNAAQAIWFRRAAS